MFQKYDVGKDRRNWDTGDCSVRALCVAAPMRTYREAWELLYALQGKHKANSFKLAEFLRRDPISFPFKTRYIKFPARAGRKRMTGEQFCLAYPQGRFILRLAHHMVACVNGTILDTWNSSEKCVYGAWQILEV